MVRGDAASAPSSKALKDLQQALDGMRESFTRAGVPDAVTPMMEALAKLGELPLSAATAQTREECDEAVKMLRLHVKQTTEAIGPGRDGSALICLYGHGNALDDAIDTLRTYAATQVLKGGGNEEGAPALAKELVAQERDIAKMRLELQRLLAEGGADAPPLGALRIDSGLVRGLLRSNPKLIAAAGIKLDSLLTEQRNLAQSPAVQAMRKTLTAAQTAADGRSNPDATYLRQRLAALEPQQLACALSEADLARLKIDGHSDEDVANVLRRLAEIGISGVADAERVLKESGRVGERLQRNRDKLSKHAADLARFEKAIDELGLGTHATWALSRGAGVTAPVPVAGVAAIGASLTLSADVDRSTQVIVSRDQEGYQLQFGSAKAAKGGVGFKATALELGSIASIGVEADVHGGAKGLRGVAYRVGDSDEGRAELKKLLRTLEKSGGLALTDLLGADQVQLETAFGGTIGAKSSANVSFELPLPSVVSNYVSVAPTAEVAGGADFAYQTTAIANEHRKELVKSRTYTFELSATADAGISLTVPNPGGGEPIAEKPLPLGEVGAEGRFVCTTSTHVLRNDDLVADTTQRSTRINGPSPAMARAVDYVGGEQLRAVVGYLKNSADPVDQAQLSLINAMIKGAKDGKSIQVTWRIAPEAKEEINKLLEQARTLSMGMGGYAPRKGDAEQAERLKAKAQTLLDDTANYQLHALELVRSQASSERLGSLSNLDLVLLRARRTVSTTTDRKIAGVDFAPSFVEGAMNSVGNSGQLRP
jgi:hypothetical protein